MRASRCGPRFGIESSDRVLKIGLIRRLLRSGRAGAAACSCSRRRAGPMPLLCSRRMLVKRRPGTDSTLTPGPRRAAACGGDPPLLYACLAGRCPARRSGGVWGRSWKPCGCSTAASAVGRSWCVASAIKVRRTAHESARRRVGAGEYARRAVATRAAAGELRVMQPDRASTASIASRADLPRKIK